MPDLTGFPWTSLAFFPVLGALVIAAALAIVAGVRAGRQGRAERRDRAIGIAVILVGLAALWPAVAVLLTPFEWD